MVRLTSRRALLRTLSGAAAGLALGGCSVRRRPEYRRTLGGPFSPPRLDEALVTRTLVGLRPFRAPGFVVRSERFGSKTLVHNYGHGGGGITLSWGSSALAVREVRSQPVGTAAVLGCGVMGLCTARLLQDRGWRVEIHARDLPPHTTSDVAGGQWAPTSVFAPNRLTAAFSRQYEEAARISHHAFAGLVGQGYGVRWMENFFLDDQPSPPPYYIERMPDLFPGARTLATREHPFPVGHCRRVVTMMVEPSIFLRRLLSDFRQAGGTVHVRTVSSLDEATELPGTAVFNCTGLGAGELVRDDELEPVRGQLVFLPPDPRVDFATVGGGRGVSYMFPRADGILLGGSFERGETSLLPDHATTQRIVEDHQRLFQGMAERV